MTEPVLLSGISKLSLEMAVESGDDVVHLFVYFV
jgi:hypothetical protein